MSHQPGDPRRELPSVSDLLQSPSGLALAAAQPHDSVVEALRAVLDSARQNLDGAHGVPAAEGLVREAALLL